MLTSTHNTTILLSHRIVESMRARLQDDRGNSFVEYAFLVALIAVVCMGAVTLLGTNNAGSASRSANSIMMAN